jgi:hypothetical protein
MPAGRLRAVTRLRERELAGYPGSRQPEAAQRAPTVQRVIPPGITHPVGGRGTVHIGPFRMPPAAGRLARVPVGAVPARGGAVDVVDLPLRTVRRETAVEPVISRAGGRIARGGRLWRESCRRTVSVTPVVPHPGH